MCEICYCVKDRGKNILIPGCMYAAVHMLDDAKDCICKDAIYSISDCEKEEIKRLKSEVNELKEIIKQQNEH